MRKPDRQYEPSSYTFLISPDPFIFSTLYASKKIVQARNLFNLLLQKLPKFSEYKKIKKNFQVSFLWKMRLVQPRPKSSDSRYGSPFYSIFHFGISQYLFNTRSTIWKNFCSLLCNCSRKRVQMSQVKHYEFHFLRSLRKNIFKLMLSQCKILTSERIF